MTDKIAIYTCIIGAYDDLHQPLVLEDGFDFICFVGLMIYSWVKHMWSTAGLKEDYRSTELLLDSMAPIHFSTYPDGTPHMENFNNRQITLCGKFKITPPSECMTEAQKEDWQRAYPPKGARMT